MKHIEIYTDGACSGNPGPGGANDGGSAGSPDVGKAPKPTAESCVRRSSLFSATVRGVRRLWNVTGTGIRQGDASRRRLTLVAV